MTMEMAIVGSSPARRTSNPSDERRREERDVFWRVTRDLEDVAGRDVADPVRDVALDRNRRLWAMLQDNLFLQDNQLPQPLKDQLISLASWVEGYTTRVLEGDGDMNALIAVNTTIMEGLG